MNKDLSTSCVFFILFMSLSCAVRPVYAGDLERVKRDVKSEASKSSREQSNRDDDGGFVGWLLEGTFDLMVDVVSASAGYSFERATGSYDPEDPSLPGVDFQRREFGDASLPFVQTELSTHNPWGGTFDLNYSVLAGFGGIAFKIKRHNYTETSPIDDFQMEQRHLLLRMSFGNNFELHQGLGTTRYRDSNGMDIEENSYTSPALYRLSSDYQLEFTPMWSESTSEYDFSINRTSKYYSIKFGYRQFRSETVELGGPFLSLAMHY